MLIVTELLGKSVMEKLDLTQNINMNIISMNSPHYLVRSSAKYYQFCRVCIAEGREKKKSAYKCEECSAQLDKDLVLCISPCFKEFHLNPTKYLEFKLPKAPKKKKV